MHIAIHDALNAISRRSQPYAYRGKAPGAWVLRDRPAELLPLQLQAAENARSRVLVGCHFRHATTVGLKHGRAIGDRVVDQALELRR